ncbi:hypothetical protein UP09_20855 [Bradyrhizobium sp. LTSP885]|uniref:hypothetical protein n=1 Tax=Bradyrhizobium sp. LTSP885 TaxID=1619232 RepID=UPI0005E1A44A|nr:hypothetical protein [Bradyrhizobium sp. LTSP885]KJC41014.1 hypothetical protein UP09_20855 [Bradyrhizobium sp. LTSP885]
MGQDGTEDPDVKPAGHDSKPEAPGKSRILVLMPYLLLPIVLILVAHYVIDIRLDTSLAYFQVIVFCIALAVGFLLSSQAKMAIATSFLIAVVITLATLLGMSGTVWIARGGGPFIPTSSREWQDVIDFSINLISATLAGHVAASFLQSTFPSFEPGDLASRAAKSLAQNPAAATGRINTTENFIKALTALILAVAALYAGIRQLFH